MTIANQILYHFPRFWGRRCFLSMAIPDMHTSMFSDGSYDNYTLWICQELIKYLSFSLHAIYVRLCTSIDEQVTGFPVGTYFAPIADCYTAVREALYHPNIKMTLYQLLKTHRGILTVCLI